jgi:hypothetical protein
MLAWRKDSLNGMLTVFESIGGSQVESEPKPPKKPSRKPKEQSKTKYSILVST